MQYFIGQFSSSVNGFIGSKIDFECVPVERKSFSICFPEQCAIAHWADATQRERSFTTQFQTFGKRKEKRWKSAISLDEKIEAIKFCASLLRKCGAAFIDVWIFHSWEFRKCVRDNFAETRLWSSCEIYVRFICRKLAASALHYCTGNPFFSPSLYLSLPFLRHF